MLESYDLALWRNHLKEAMEYLKSNKTSTPLLQNLMQFQNPTFKIFHGDFQIVLGMQCCFSMKHVNINGLITTYLVKSSRNMHACVKCSKLLWNQRRCISFLDGAETNRVTDYRFDALNLNGPFRLLRV